MGWPTFIVCAIPLYLLYNTGQSVLWTIALLNTIANLWSYGIMHNYSVEDSVEKINRLQENLAIEGRLDAEKQAQIDKIPVAKNLQAVPGWLTTVNLVKFVVGIAFVGYGVWLIAAKRGM